MRASHSIKGAARIVQIEPAVKIAHVMEDCFMAAMERNITITPNHIDCLLQGVDFLQSVGKVEQDEFNTWLSEQEANAEKIVEAIASILNPQHTDTPQPTWVRCKDKPQISKKRNSIFRQISTAIKAIYYNKILAKNNLFDSVTISK